MHCKVGETAKKACRHDFISALPDGYNSVIGEGGTLSGGEKHRFFMQQISEADVPPDIAAQEACKLEHVINETSFKKLKGRIEH